MAARSMAWVCGCSLDATAGPNSAEDIESLSLVSVVFCQAEICALG
jgi:hypothetical protein